jgi:hypothetical protein
MMMKIYVLNGGIIAADGDCVETETAYEFPYVTIFKSILNLLVVDVQVPPDYSRLEYLYVDNEFVRIE